MILILQDVGSNDDIDSAVCSLVERKRVSGISVFATGKNAARMISRANTAGIAVGAHLAINASADYRLQYTKDHTNPGIFSGDFMPVRKDERLEAGDIRSEFCEQMSIITDVLGRPPDYFDSHCFHIRNYPELYRTILDSFGSVPIIQRNDPYTGIAHRFSGKIQCMNISGARRQLSRFSERDFVFSHVASGIRHSWKMSYLALLKKRLPVMVVPFFEQETQCES